MTQKTTLPLTFTGPKAELLPRFLADLPVASGLVRRYSASATGASIGGSVVSWPNMAGTDAPLTAAVASARPTLKEESGRQYVSFDGVDDVISGPNGIEGVKTLAVVARFREPVAPSTPVGGNWAAFSVTGPGSGNGAISLTPSGTIAAYSGTNLVHGTPPGTDWHVFLAVFNGATSILALDGVEITGSTGAIPSGTAIGAGRNTNSEAGHPCAKLDLADVAIWNRALTATERASLFTSLRDLHGL